MSTLLATKPLILTFNLDQCLRVFNDTKKRVLTVALVTERLDRYNTIINPEGCITDFRNVIVDFRHSRISTGARLTNKRIGEVTLDTGETVRALIGDLEVYQNNELNVVDKITGATRSDGNAYEAVESGRIIAVSVDFMPIESSIWFNEKTGVTEYRQWSLRCLSLLDIPAGQEDSIILNIRSLDNFSTQKTMSKYTKGQEVLIRATVEEVTEDGQIKVTTPETVTEDQIVEEQQTRSETTTEVEIETEPKEDPEMDTNEEIRACKKRLDDLEAGYAEMRGMLTTPKEPSQRSLSADLKAEIVDEIKAELLKTQSEHLRSMQVETPKPQASAPIGQDQTDPSANGDAKASKGISTEFLLNTRNL